MYNGMLCVYKERSYTSHDVVARLRGILGQKKIGHTGTLDPDAEGVLPVCLGCATKLSDMLSSRWKSYRAVMLLGVTTDTQDLSGQVLDKKEVSCTEDEIRSAVLSFTGVGEQLPPMYSAVRVNGKRLYEIARKGRTVERKTRRVEIEKIGIERIEIPHVTMTVRCSKGTYIRTLCHDIGTKLGCGACMESLLRTEAGGFDIDDALRLSEIEEIVKKGEIGRYIVPVDEMLSEYPALSAAGEDADRILHNGGKLSAGSLKGSRDTGPCDGQKYRVYDSGGNFTAVYEYSGREGLYKNFKMFIAK